MLVGTSGFAFDSWRGAFYPREIPSGEMLSYYARHFRVVEVNFTFYRLASHQSFEGLLRKSPKEFRFAAKLFAGASHGEHWTDASKAFFSSIEPLTSSGRLGAVVAQFSARFRPSQAAFDRLEGIKALAGQIPLVAEFRHRSWATDQGRAFLTRNGLGFCCSDLPALPWLMPPVAWLTSDVGYVRLHGRNAQAWSSGGDRYDHDYSREELSSWVDKIQTLSGKAKKVYVFFNNCHAGRAATNAKLMQELLNAVGL